MKSLVCHKDGGEEKWRSKTRLSKEPPLPDANYMRNILITLVSATGFELVKKECLVNSDIK